MEINLKCLPTHSQTEVNQQPQHLLCLCTADPAVLLVPIFTHAPPTLDHGGTHDGLHQPSPLAPAGKAGGKHQSFDAGAADVESLLPASGIQRLGLFLALKSFNQDITSLLTVQYSTVKLEPVQCSCGICCSPWAHLSYCACGSILHHHISLLQLLKVS